MDTERLELAFCASASASHVIGRSGLLGGAGVEGLGVGRLAAGDEVDVDAGRARLMDNLSQDRPAFSNVPPAVLNGPDHDLGYLVLAREADQSPGRIVIFYLVPARSEG